MGDWRAKHNIFAEDLSFRDDAAPDAGTDADDRFPVAATMQFRVISFAAERGHSETEAAERLGRIGHAPGLAPRPKLNELYTRHHCGAIAMLRQDRHPAAKYGELDADNPP